MIKAKARFSPKTMDWVYKRVPLNCKLMKFNPVKLAASAK